MWPKKKFFKNDSLQTSLCKYIVLRRKNILRLIAFHVR